MMCCELYLKYRLRALKGRLIHLLVSSIVGVIPFGHVTGFELHELELPIGTVTQWVAGDLTHNGLPMQIQTFASELEVPAVAAHFKQLWSKNGFGDVPATLEQSMGDWTIISSWHDGRHVVVQVRPGITSELHRTEGFVSLLDPVRNSASVMERFSGSSGGVGHGLPQPDNSLLISVSRSRDALSLSGSSSTLTPKLLTATTVLISSESSVRSNRDFYLRSMKRSGWRLVADSEALSRTEDEYSLFYSRNGGTCEIAISRTPDGSSLVTLNHIQL